MSTTQDETVSILIDRAEYRGWTDVEIVRGIDSCSAVSFSAPFDRSSAADRARFRPFAFRDCTVLVNGSPLFDGTMVDVKPGVNPGESKIGVSCYSRPAVLSDVCMPASAYPLEFNGLTLSQVAERICRPFGITVTMGQAEAAASSGGSASSDLVADPAAERIRASRIRMARSQLVEMLEALQQTPMFPADNAARAAALRNAQVAEDRLRAVSRGRAPSSAASSIQGTAAARIDGAPFGRVAIEPDKVPWSFLSELAKQRGVILSDTPVGELLILKSTEGGRPVARLREGTHPLQSVSASFAPNGYHSEITGLAGARPGAAGSSYTERNPRLSGVVRPSTFKPDDTESSDVPAAVRARMGRMFGNLVTYQLEVPTWRDPSGALWSPNTTVTLLAPNAMVYRETELLVREVTLKRSAGSISATLSVVLPGAFSGGIPERLPWDD